MASKITSLTDNEVQELLDTSYAKTEILKKLGFDKYNGNHRTLTKRLNKSTFNYEKFNENAKSWRSEFLQNMNSELPVSEFFSANGVKSSSSLKARILKDNLIIYSCSKCHNNGQWENDKLSLHLDHIDGNNTNNVLSNLRFLCPNCHSQTETYAGKRHNKNKTVCSNCQGKKVSNSTLCQKCNAKTRINSEKYCKLIITKEELYDLIWNQKLSYVRIGKMFGVSDNAIRKKAIVLGIENRRIKNTTKENRTPDFHLERVTT